jgi:tetratricopeptide (TPR) repeat protein
MRRQLTFWARVFVALALLIAVANLFPGLRPPARLLLLCLPLLYLFAVWRYPRVLRPLVAQVNMVCTQLVVVVGLSRDYYRALMSSWTGRPERAIALSERFVQRHPKDPRGWAVLALALAGAERCEAALEPADRSLQLKDNWLAHSARGLALLFLGVDATSDLRSEHALNKTLRASVLVGSRRLDAAISALEGLPGRAKYSLSFLTLGDAYRLRGRAERAAGAYEQAVRYAQTEIASFLPSETVLATALAWLGELEGAEEPLRQALARNGSTTDGSLAEALVHRQRGDANGVLATLEGIMAANPGAAADLLADPHFTPLFAEERFRRLFVRATAERNRILERLRSRIAEENGA